MWASGKGAKKNGVGKGKGVAGPNGPMGSGIRCDFAELGADGLPVYLGDGGIGDGMELDFGGSLGVGCRFGNGRIELLDREAVQDCRKAVGWSLGVGQDDGDVVDGVQFGGKAQDFVGGKGATIVGFGWFYARGPDS